jgi:hypothetical protein
VKTKPFLLLVIVVAGIAGFFLSRRGADRSDRSDPSDAEEMNLPGKATPAPWAPRRPAAPAEPPEPAMPASRSALLDLIDRVFAALQVGPNEAAIDELKRTLLASDPRQAIRAIEDFLAEGRDAPTGGEFSLGEKGALAGSPTLRVLLLDLLGQLSRGTRSDAAAKVSRAILEAKDSADEWAVALRNVAWHEPGAKPYLAGKMREMLAYEPWRTRPSAGMLEAFDVIVYAQDTALVPDLAEMQRSSSRELQYAAAIALDRLAEQGPLEVMTYLNTHPTELADRPLLRADYYAKADLAQIAQRAAVEVYLGRPDVTAEEKGKLLKGLATPATFVAETLLTEPPPPDDGAARLDALTRATAGWLRADRFPDLRPQLTQLQQRLGR